MIGRNPFLGARPYGLAQSAMFFGRSRAGQDLTHMIELHPMVAVVAPSGIGKTSLLRASVAPQLEIKGLHPVYMRPDPTPDSGNDGAKSLLEGRMEVAVLDALLPDPALEAVTLALIGRAWGAISLDEAASRYRDLNPADELRAKLLHAGSRIVERMSMVARFLNGTFDKSALVAQWAQLDEDTASALAANADVKTLRKLFASSDLKLKALKLREDLRADTANAETFAALRSLTEGHVPGFKLLRPDGDPELKPRIILMIDQFEQVFTLSSQDSKDQLLDVLRSLSEAALPIHIVLALRKEWYADLARHLYRRHLRPQVRQFETFYLDAISPSEARQIMADVPRSIGDEPIPEIWQRRFLEHLQVDEFVDPVTLSIACHELYDAGRDFHGRLDEEELLDAFDVEDLLGTYLNRAIQSIGEPNDISEAIDMLGEIAGSGTTRDFITQSRILSAPLRDPARRQRVLEHLQRLFLIRGDSPRRGAEPVYDIMHERLIEPVRALVATRNDIVNLRNAAARIVAPDAIYTDLDFDDLRVVLLASDRLALNARASGIVLCALLRLDWKDRDASRAARLARECGFPDVAQWFREITGQLATSASQPAPAEEGLQSRLVSGWWLSELELQEYLYDSRTADRGQGGRNLLLLNTLLRQTPSQRTRRLLRRVLTNVRSEYEFAG